MGLFNKKEANYDPLNIKVTDLHKGWLFDYDLKNWMVTAEFEYDWGDNFFTKEYKIESGDDTYFLSVEDDDELNLCLMKKIKVRSVDENLPEYILQNEAPPAKIEYQGITYLKEEQSPGYFHDVDEDPDNWTEFISWDYYSEDEKYILTIEQWGQEEFEASQGHTVKEYQISNIIPGEDTQPTYKKKVTQKKSNSNPMKTVWIIVIGIVLLIVLSRGCGGCGCSQRTSSYSPSSSSSSYYKTPLDDIIKDLSQKKTFSIILYDMNVDGSFSKTYKHKYRIITEKDSVPQEKTTEWYKVPEGFFMQNMNNMGMEIASKGPDGKVKKAVSPPGYSNYIGNSRYGQWRTRSDGSSFWEFYGKYAMMSSMFNLMSNPVRRSYYDDYRTNYYGSRSYYGPRSSSGSYMYGTNSPYTKSSSSSKSWYSKASNKSFQDRVRSQVSRSSSSSSSKTTRSTSRYSSSSSSSRTRSSGGFGK